MSMMTEASLRCRVALSIPFLMSRVLVTRLLAWWPGCRYIDLLVSFDVRPAAPLLHLGMASSLFLRAAICSRHGPRNPSSKPLRHAAPRYQERISTLPHARSTSRACFTQPPLTASTGLRCKPRNIDTSTLCFRRCRSLMLSAPGVTARACSPN